MFKLEVTRQESFSRLQLILGILFGWLYIGIPHLVALLFVVFVGKLLWVYATFVILITGKYPKGIWDFQVGILNWLSRFHLSSYNLMDGYPSFGLNGSAEQLKIEITYNEAPDRLWVLLRFMFAGVLLFPHFLVWTFRNLWSGILSFLAIFAVLFTGSYPEKWFEFNVGTLRWVMRIMAYQVYLIDDYPPFSGKE